MQALQNDAVANRRRVAFNETVERLQQSVTSRALVPFVEQLLADTTAVMQSCNQFSLAGVNEELARVRAKYADSRQRALDQLAAASTGEQIAATLQALGISEDRIASEYVHFKSDRIGRYFQVTR